MKKQQKKQQAKQPLSSQQVKAVAKIAAKASKTVAETKIGYAVREPFSLSERSIRSYNLVNDMGFTNSGNQTGEAAKVVGDSILLKGYAIRGLLRNNPGNSNLPTTITFALLKADPYRTVTNLSDSEILPSYGGTDALPRFDATKCQVIKRWQKTIYPAENNIGGQVAFHEYVDLKNTKIKFKDLVADQDLMGKNYYLVFYASNFGVTKGTANAGRVEFTHELYYKDS